MIVFCLKWGTWYVSCGVSAWEDILKTIKKSSSDPTREQWNRKQLQALAITFLTHLQAGKNNESGCYAMQVRV